MSVQKFVSLRVRHSERTRLRAIGLVTQLEQLHHHSFFISRFGWGPHPNACKLVGGGFIYTDKIRLFPADENLYLNEENRHLSYKHFNFPADEEMEWHVELGRLTFEGHCYTGGGDKEKRAVREHLDKIYLTEEKARRSNCYVMFMQGSERVLLYVEDPELNVASYYALTLEVRFG